MSNTAQARAEQKRLSELHAKVSAKVYDPGPASDQDGELRADLRALPVDQQQKKIIENSHYRHAMARYRGDHPLKTVAVELHRAEIARTNPAGVALLETQRSALEHLETYVGAWRSKLDQATSRQQLPASMLIEE